MSDQDRLLAAWYRIGSEVPARIVNIVNRIFAVQVRLAKCPDNHADEVASIRDALNVYRDYCSEQLSASIVDPDVLEAHAHHLEDSCTDMELDLGELEEYCRKQGH